MVIQRNRPLVTWSKYDPMTAAEKNEAAAKEITVFGVLFNAAS